MHFFELKTKRLCHVCRCLLRFHVQEQRETRWKGLTDKASPRRKTVTVSGLDPNFNGGSKWSPTRREPDDEFY
jgi:hypothetical protein